MGLQYSKSPVEERNKTELERPEEDKSPLKEIFYLAGRILGNIAKLSYHLLQGFYYLLQGLYNVLKGVFHTVQGMLYFLVGSFGKQGTAIILASFAVFGVGYYIYTKDPNFAHQHVKIVDKTGTEYVQLASSNLGGLSSKLPDFVSKNNLSEKLGDLSSKVEDFVSKGKNDIWSKFDWTSK